ncbi:MAG: phage Gp37/Gp68 family protein [Beijerinckiaceae bacterium]|nr:phage Gp37/Gp68 family protein [Beijerinckiaceae bacterium]
MSADITIEWADSLWDPVVGCTRKSAACRHCYAEALTAKSAQDQQWGSGFAEIGPSGSSWTGKIAMRDDRLTLPLTWESPRRILVNALSDLFHEAAPQELIDRIFAVIALTPHHIFQILTKRPKIMQAYIADVATPVRIARMMDEILPEAEAHSIAAWPLPHVWLGVTAENQKEADRRIPALLETPAALRFAAAEPLLEAVDLKAGIWLRDMAEGQTGPRLDWVVAGGEIGAEAKPCHPDWARSLRDQCAKSGTPFFWRQWGEYTPNAGVTAAPLLSAKFADLKSLAAGGGRQLIGKNTDPLQHSRGRG